MSLGVVVLEDDPVVRRGVVDQITASEKFFVAAEASDVETARRAIVAGTASLGIFDLELSDASSLPLIPLAVEHGMNVLVLTIWDDDERVYRALGSGAGGYLLKGDPSANRVADALGVLIDGGAPISPTIARRLLEDFRLRPPPSTTAVSPDASGLTGREREIIELFAKGATYEEVANVLSLSVNTVRYHVRSMYRKLHVCSKTEAVTMVMSRS